MGYIGTKPSAVPLTSADITDGIITSAKIVDGTIVNADINASAGVVFTKLASTGTLTVDNIQFPATAVASANANNLDDYEEGTFTPTWSTGTATYVFQVGKYTKIGNVVYFTINIKSSSVSSMTSPNINGLPFTSVNLTNSFATCANFPVLGFEVLGDAGIASQINPNSTSITLYYVSQNAAANYNGLDNTEVNETSNLEIAITGHYFV